MSPTLSCKPKFFPGSLLANLAGTNGELAFIMADETAPLKVFIFQADRPNPLRFRHFHLAYPTENVEEPLFLRGFASRGVLRSEGCETSHQTERKL